MAVSDVGSGVLVVMNANMALTVNVECGNFEDCYSSWGVLMV